MTKTYAERKEVPLKDQTFDATSAPKNHKTPTDEKDFGIRGIEDNLAADSENPATHISDKPLDR